MSSRMIMRHFQRKIRIKEIELLEIIQVLTVVVVEQTL